MSVNKVHIFTHLIDSLIFNITCYDVHVNSGNRQCMQYNDKNKRKKYFKNYTYVKTRCGTNDFLCISESRLGSS